ncbi:unnamed protein product [Schistosoma turkestanicum]|nr:unnamed protein product [Schistosoma turkestanicum]
MMNVTMTVSLVDDCNQLWNFSQIINSPLRIITFNIATIINLGIFATNLFMISILLMTKNKRFDATRKLLINLSIIDMNFAICILPMSIMYIILKMHWIPCHIICHLWIISDVYFCSTNMFNLVIIAFDRMLAVNYAVKYNQIMSPTRVRLLILLIWLLAFIIVLPLAVVLIWNYLQQQQQQSATMDDYSLHYERIFNNVENNNCVQHECSLLRVNIYLRLFIVLFSMYIPTGLMCYFYFHVFTKVIINKRGISIGLLIDKDSIYQHRKYNNNKRSTFDEKSLDEKKCLHKPTNTIDKDAVNAGKISKVDKINKEKNKKMICSKYGLLRVHVGGKHLQYNSNSNNNNNSNSANYKYNSNTNINNNNNNHENSLQQEKLINTYDPMMTGNTSPTYSTNQEDLSYHREQQCQEPPDSPYTNTEEVTTSNLFDKSDCISTNAQTEDSILTNLIKTNHRLQDNRNNNNNNGNNGILIKKHSNSLSEVVFKVNKNKLDDTTNYHQSSSQQHQQPHQQQQHQSHSSPQKQQNLKVKLTNILRKHSFHTLSPYTYLKPSESNQSRRSTGRTDKDAKFHDLITLRRCALMPLGQSTACSSISNEYTNSGRNSENLSNYSTTQITPRNSNHLEHRSTNVGSDQPQQQPQQQHQQHQHYTSSLSENYHFPMKVKRTIEFKAISMFLLNISSIILCWLPYSTLLLFTDILLPTNLCLSFSIYDFFYWLRFVCIAFNPFIYGSASEDLRKAFKRFILHCGKVKHEKKALKRLVLAGLGAAGIPYGHRIIIPPQQMKSTEQNHQNKSVVFNNKPLMLIADND